MNVIDCCCVLRQTFDDLFALMVAKHEYITGPPPPSWGAWVTVRLGAGPQTRPVPRALCFARAAATSAAVSPVLPARFRFSGRRVAARAAGNPDRNTKGTRGAGGRRPSHVLHTNMWCATSNAQACSPASCTKTRTQQDARLVCPAARHVAHGVPAPPQHQRGKAIVGHEAHATRVAANGEVKHAQPVTGNAIGAWGAFMISAHLEDVFEWACCVSGSFVHDPYTLQDAVHADSTKQAYRTAPPLLLADTAP